MAGDERQVTNVALSALAAPRWAVLCGLLEAAGRWKLQPDVVSYCAAVACSQRQPRQARVLPGP